MPGVLGKTPLTVDGDRLLLRLTEDTADLSSERVFNRLRGFARLLGKQPAIET